MTGMLVPIVLAASARGYFLCATMGPETTGFVIPSDRFAVDDIGSTRECADYLGRVDLDCGRATTRRYAAREMARRRSEKLNGFTM